MPVTLPTTWTNLTLNEIQPRQAISEGLRGELASHINQANRNHAKNVAVNLGSLVIGPRGAQEDLNTLTYTLLSIGEVRAIGALAQLQVQRPQGLVE